MCLFFFKQKTAYEMRISDWSSDVCSSDLAIPANAGTQRLQTLEAQRQFVPAFAGAACQPRGRPRKQAETVVARMVCGPQDVVTTETAPCAHFCKLQLHATC